MKVKICGIKSLEEALTAIDAGADMLGYNFYQPSKRYITPDRCAVIQAGLENRKLSVTTVGVFVNETPKTIIALMDKCNLDFAQLSGDESPQILKKLGSRAFKAIHTQNLDKTMSDAKLFAGPNTPSLLVDSYKPGDYGGTGEVGDWNLAGLLAKSYPILLAGGLHPGNISQAIERVHPWGVDVASGVESIPGQKDPQKIRVFIQRVKEVSL